MNEAVQTDGSWLSEAKKDIDQWAAMMPKNADNQLIDWQWVASLDMERGIGAAATQHIDAILAFLRDGILRDDCRDRTARSIAVRTPTA